MILSNSMMDAKIDGFPSAILDHSEGTRKTAWMHRFAEESHLEIIEYLRDSKRKCESAYWACLLLLLIAGTITQMVMVIIKYQGK